MSRTSQTAGTDKPDNGGDEMDEENYEIAHARMLTSEKDGGFWPNLEFATHRLIVETTQDGKQVGARFIDVSHSRNGAGTLFGLAVAPNGSGVYFVDDGNNTLNILQ